jgi:hypothetical protein
MIKPPFTLLILKKSHNPVTVRITAALIGIAVIIIIFIICVSGLVLSFVFLPQGGFLTKSGIMAPTAVNKTNFVPINPSESSQSGESQSQPDITGMTVSRLKKDGLRISFRITNVTFSDIMYIWLVANPEADTAAERVMYPRSPVFRGLPVAYKNGIIYHPMEHQEITITLGSNVVNTDVKQYRVLVYKADGTLIIDKQFVSTRAGLREV